MKRLRILVLALAGVLGLSVAVAQVIPVPIVATHQSPDLMQVIPNGIPNAQSQYCQWNCITNVFGYYKNGTGTQNQTYSTGANLSYVTWANASSITTLSVYLPTAPLDGAKNCYFSIGGAGTLNLYAGLTTQTLNNAITAMTANTQYCYLYSVSNTSWDRVQ
jgi:hypothetical protein